MKTLLALVMLVLLGVSSTVMASDLCEQSVVMDVAGITPTWTATGVEVATNDVLWIHATGRVWYSGADWSNPDGCRVRAAGADSCRCRFLATNPGSLAPGLVAYGLVGRIGNGAPFFIGSDLFVPVTDQCVGELQLAFNDDAYTDNTLSFNVEICKNPCVFNQSAAPDPSPTTGQFRSGRAFPNPFREGTQYSFSLPEQSRVLMTVVDVSGRRVAEIADDVMPKGAHQLNWNGRDSRGEPVPAGVYFMKLTVDGQNSMTKMVSLR